MMTETRFSFNKSLMEFNRLSEEIGCAYNNPTSATTEKINEAVIIHHNQCL